MEATLTSGQMLSLTEINLKKVYSEKKKQTFYAVHHNGQPYFIGKSLKNDDGTPNKQAFQEGVQLGTISSDGRTTNVCWKANSWEAVSLMITDKEVVGA